MSANFGKHEIQDAEAISSVLEVSSKYLELSILAKRTEHRDIKSGPSFLRFFKPKKSEDPTLTPADFNVELKVIASKKP